MTLIQRLARLLKADLHGILDGLEDPEEVVKQTIRDMEEALTAKEQSLSALQAIWQRLTTESQTLERAAQEAEQHLELCFQEGNDTLARTFIRKRLENTQQSRQVARALADNQAQRVALEQTIAEQRAQLASVVQQLHNLTAARQQAGGVAAAFVPGQQPGGISEDDIEVAFLQEKRRRTPSSTANH